MINEIMEGLPGKFRPEMAGNLSTTIQFNFSETEQRFWVLTIGDGRCTIIEGMVE